MPGTSDLSPVSPSTQAAAPADPGIPTTAPPAAGVSAILQPASAPAAFTLPASDPASPAAAPSAPASLAAFATSGTPASAPPNSERPATASPMSGPPEPDKKQPYPPPANLPTQLGPAGIRFDFNHGARVILPNRTTGKWRVRLRDLDTGNILFQSENQGAYVSSSKRFYVRFSVDVWDLDEAGVATSVLSHGYDARGQEILIQFPIGTLGDILAWFPYASRFAEVHGCRLTCAMSELLIPLLRDAYPQIRFVTHEQLIEQKLPETVYATYCLGLFFDDKDCVHQPTDFRHVGLHRTAGYILGVDPDEEAPRLSPTDDGPPIADPYVCVAVQSSNSEQELDEPGRLARGGYVPQGQRLPGDLHRQGASARHRPGVEPHPARYRGRDRRPPAAGARALAAPCQGVRRAEQRAVVAGLGGGLPGGDDQRVHPPEQRVHHAVPGD